MKKVLNVKMTPEQLGMLLNGQVNPDGGRYQMTRSFEFGDERISVSTVGVLRPERDFYVVEVELVSPQKFSGKERK